MPNGYSVFPNVFPGNVTIGGSLTVAGDLIRIGTALPYVRVGKSVSGNLMLSFNVQGDQSTRDSGAGQAWALLNPSNGIDARQNKLNAAGALQQTADLDVLFTDYTPHVHTGTISTDQIYARQINGHVIGANGGLHLHMSFFVSAQGAVATNIITRLGGTNLHQLTLPINIANKAWMYDLWLRNRNAENVQEVHALATDLTDATIFGFRTVLGIDTTINQSFAVFAASGAVGDSQQFDTFHVALDNSFGPV